ncbi:hypothetical protein HHI36_007092 [Cryptolaemus montrouzieri]|uniref:Zinc finger PHD-type domain-containing protein n=1 Tax=Cryptolaemus montrouzieri TaxID=559131 RepID=A0ABD2MNI4_9CUCU
MLKKSCEKLTLGKHPILDFDNEKRLVAHIRHDFPQHDRIYFAISDNSFQNLDEENLAQDQPVARELDANADVTSYYVEPQPGPSSSTVNSEREPDFGFLLYEDLAADAIIIPLEGNVSPSILSQNHNVETVEVITPEEHINSKKAKLKGKAKKHTPDKPRKNNQKSVPKKKRPRFSSESEQEFDESDSDQTKSDKVNTQCKECFDDYASTKSTADWIQCLMCKLWLHEDCTLYGDYCNRCGHKKKLAALKANLAKVNSKNK